MCEWLCAAYLILDVGIINHNGWEDAYGDKVGRVEWTQEIFTANRASVNISAEHVSSTNTSDDRGINAIYLGTRVKLY